MAWRGPRTVKDQTYSTKAWAKVKAHWISQRIPTCRAERCLLPGVAIDYEPPFTKPASFNAGHIVPKWKAKLLGWTIEQMNAISNTRPEHRKCNGSDGARIGQRRQRAATKATALRW